MCYFPFVPSKGEINRSGELLRQVRLNPSLFSFAERQAAIQFVEDFRKGYSYPLLKVNTGLRAMVAQVTSDIVVAQRLKRMPQIIHKLERFPGTNLARMEDLGGCRAVLETSDEVDLVHQKITRNWAIIRVRDYVQSPKLSGYRAIHLVVERDNHRIEVQLRTKGQQARANVVEKVAASYQLPLKDEIGPDEVMEWLLLAAEGIAYKDRGETVPTALKAELSTASEIAFAWMEAEGAK